MQTSLETRSDAVELFLNMIRPLKAFYSPYHAFLCVGSSGVHYGEKAAEMEGFARVLWGLAPLWSADNTGLPIGIQQEIDGWMDWYRQGIIHGTNPDDDEYWGDIFDFDQKMVEAPAIAYTLAVNREKLWESLTGQQKDHVYGWLNQVNLHDMPQSNWRCFRIMVNIAFRLLGLPWSQDKLEEDFGIIDRGYIGDGWYFDGHPEQLDYYVAFAIHHDSLLYGRLMEDFDPERSRIFKERATRFFEDFVYWFANDGNELPFGRSLTYRFAHCGPLAAMAYAGLDLDYGVLKNLILRNLELWISRPIFDNAGVLTIGYGYPNICMSENYNSCGSPYWGCKAFLILGLDETHPFWQAKPTTYDYKPRKFLKHPHMLITHDDHDHILAYVTGQHCKGNHGQAPEKYEKFVYSNQFGFSISRDATLEGGAFDNTLAISRAGENCYRMRYGMEEFEANEETLSVTYSPMTDVMVKSTIVPCSSWYVRIHKIHTQVSIDLADGGFALPQERCHQIEKGPGSGRYKMEDVARTEHGLIVDFPWGISCIESETGQKAELITPYANTNLFHNLTVIPTVRETLEPGDHLVITSVAADLHQSKEMIYQKKPEVEVEGDQVRVIWEEHTVTVDIGR